jgi:methionyl-tRNA synthetase
MPETATKFFLTTPIYYVNARPHIGHAYSTIAADVIARRHRLLGEDTYFLTGTDEHGQKVQRSAEAAGIPPQQFADQVSGSFSGLWKRMGITNDDYIRTTEERHRRGVQHLWRELEARGAIYLSSYTGQYCVSDEAFVDVPVDAACPTCGRPTETVTEENYFFRLSNYQLPLIDLIESGELHIQPETARNEVLSFLRGGLKDLSISRTTFDWGIPVPSSESVILSEAKNPRISPEAPQKPTEKHVIYVWLDALANYITAIGYGSNDPADHAKFARYWPADLHLVGKEITRFHCVYWPAILLAAGLPLPKSIVANGWLLFEESKMSKSRGNIVRTETILDAFGPLCPPVPIAPTTEAVIPSERSESRNPRILTAEPQKSVILSEGVADAESKDPDASGSADTSRTVSTTEPALVPPGSSGRSSGLQPPESTPHAGGALAPGLAAPTKAQQDLFAADVLRYFLLREIPFGQDGTFSFDALITRYNADLANGYGNLVSRTLKMIQQYLGGVVPADIAGLYQYEHPVASKAQQIGELTEYVSRQKLHKIEQLLADYNFASYVANVQVLIKWSDEALSKRTPWKERETVEKTADNRSKALYLAAESIRIITALLYPVLPYATASVWRQLGLGDIEEAACNGELKDLKWGGLQPGTKLGPLAPIFPRADKGLAQLMTEMENPATPATPATPTPTAATAAPAVPTNNQQPATSISDLITIDDFAKVDLRVAQIVVAERIPKADKLLRLEVDLGPNFNPPRRQILAGIAEYYTPESLIGRKVVIVANLAPRKMRGLESQGMVVAASVGPDGAPVLAGFLEDVELGARLK